MEGKREPYDEDAMLAELERLRDSIQAARRARQEKSDEFDRVVQGFKRPPAPPIARQSEPEPEPRAVAPPPAAGAPLADTLPPLAPAPPPVVVDPSAPRALTRQPRRPVASRSIAIAILVVAIAAIAFFWPRKPLSRIETPSTSNQAPAAAVQAPPVQAAPLAPPPSTPAPVAAVSLELRTLRPVWMRVMVDGQRQREGMVPGNERPQFNANHTIVVRVGNGADVVIKTATGEEPFGAAGQPVTRTFAKGEAAK